MLARYTAPLVNSGERRLPIPAPLHRTRLWNYWFNQSAPVARELSRRLGIAAELIVLHAAHSLAQGHESVAAAQDVAGAFGVRDEAAVAG